MLGKNAVAKATGEALNGSRQIEVRYTDTIASTLAIAYLQALAFAKLILLPTKRERRLNQVFRYMSWNGDNRTVVITFTNKFVAHNISLFSEKLAKAIEHVVVVKNDKKTTAKHIPKGKKSCKK